jgi:hypothetical protein
MKGALKQKQHILVGKLLQIAYENGTVKSTIVSAMVGMGVSIGLAVMWRLVNFDYINLSNEARDVLSGVTLLLCPSSLLLMEVGSREPMTIEVASLYGTVIVANAVTYGVVVLLSIGIFRLSQKLGRTKKDKGPDCGRGDSATEDASEQ